MSIRRRLPMLCVVRSFLPVQNCLPPRSQLVCRLDLSFQSPCKVSRNLWDRKVCLVRSLGMPRRLVYRTAARLLSVPLVESYGSPERAGGGSGTYLYSDCSAVFSLRRMLPMLTVPLVASKGLPTG